MPANARDETTTFRATVLEAFHLDHVGFPSAFALGAFLHGHVRAWAAMSALTLTVWLVCWLRTWVRVEASGVLSGRHDGKRFEILPSRIQAVQWWSKWGMRQAWVRTTTGETFGLPPSIVCDSAFQQRLPVEVIRHEDPKEADRQASIAGISILVTVILPLVLLMLWGMFH